MVTAKIIKNTSKRDLILESAGRIFSEKGYVAGSVGDIAAMAGVSKATIYSYFSSKLSLFEAVVSSRCDVVYSLIRIPCEYDDAYSALCELAISFMSMIKSPQAVSLYRIVLEKNVLSSELGKAFYCVGPAATRQKIIIFFKDMINRNILIVPEREVAVVVDLFIGMMTGDMYVNATLNDSPEGRDSFAKTAKYAVDMILARYGVS